MKRLVLFILCIGISPMLLSQKKTRAEGWHFDESIYAFNISYTAKKTIYCALFLTITILKYTDYSVTS